jgi:iron complex outermembrane recepter protein
MKRGFCLLLLCSTTIAHAQFNFTGKIIDASSGKSIPGATVLLKGSEQGGAITDSSGDFTFTNITSGSYHLQISCIGFTTYKQEVIIRNNSTENIIYLHHLSLLVKPLEVSGSRAGKDAPFSKTEISRAALQKYNLGQDMPYLLNQQPSVVINSDAGTGIGYTGIYIRGTDETRINVTINGIPVNDAEDQGTYWVDIPDLVSSTNSIQIQRGVGSSTNGAGAFGGTINISTNQFHDSAYGEINSSYGSFNTFKNTVNVGSGLLDQHFTVDARLSKITSDGYIDRAFAHLESFYLSTAYLVSKTAIRFNVFSGKEQTYQAWDGVPEDSLATNRTYNDLGLEPDGSYYSNQTDNYEQDYYQLFINHTFNTHYNFSGALFLTKGDGYYEEFEIDQPYSDYGLPNPVIAGDTITNTDLIQDLWLYNYYYGTIFSFNHTGLLNWTIGGGWDQYDGQHYGNIVWAEYAIKKDYQYYYDIAHKKDFNIYWKGDKNLTNNLSVYADLQYRYVLYNIDGFDDNPGLIQHNHYNFINPKVGLHGQLSDHQSLYLSYAVANKEPNRDDYEANLLQTPKPEHLEDWEAGYDQKGKKYSFHGDLYYMYYKDQLVLTGQINDVGEYTRTNIPISYRAGIELSGDVKFSKIFSVYANATVSRNKIQNFTEYIDDYDNGGQEAIYHGSTDIAFSPDLIAAATLTAQPLKNLEFDLLSKYVGLQYLDNTSDANRSMPAFWVNNFSAIYSVHTGWVKEIRFQLMVNNLLNTKYVNNGYTYSYIQGGKIYTDNSYFPQAGINFLFGVKVGF